jgi:hypothetical protein
MQKLLKKRPHSDDVSIDLRKLFFSLQHYLLDAIRLIFGRRPIVERYGLGLHGLESLASINQYVDLFVQETYEAK